jgi:hypothetical protein
MRVWPDGPWDELNVSRGMHALQVIATAPSASAWLAANHARFANHPNLLDLGNPRLVHSTVCACSVEANYRVAMGVISKAGEPWDSWGSERLPAKAREELSSRFAVQVSRRLADFGVPVEPDALCLRIINDGQPRPIPMPGTRGFALARKDLLLAMAWRLTGEIAVGRLNKVGYGRLFAAAR